MHILVVNDDGPPNDSCSPYILPFVQALRRDKHIVTVVIPSTPQSWISKAHLVGKSLTSVRHHPNPLAEDEGVEWTVVNGTPASCTQLGLYHLTSHLPPVDLVVSGPNWGRNVTTLYNLASGTVGGALEGAQCGKRAIAISFASKDKEPKDIIEAACRVSARLVSRLMEVWAAGVELYAVNVPMISGVDTRKAEYTTSLPCYWTQNSLFQEAIKETPERAGTREFVWRPQLKDVERGVSRAYNGTDGSAMVEGHISVTPMIATFRSVDGLTGSVFR
ncbi:survival protein sure-like phosphatase/nucleotidase [Leptodontidium sp. 2 PMI_412]|nr:survival protein sure-like phosphatase/nucleotidase [Leptodontidium sp. 2 PMI_412]